VNGFPWLAIGSLAGIAVFVALAVLNLGRAIGRAERKANQPRRERTRLSRRERRRFKRLARRTGKANPDLKKNARKLTGGTRGHYS
jgi:hypothetical protein